VKRSIPSAEDLEWIQKQALKTRYPLLTLGIGEQRVTIKEEEREHTHIIGTTGEGKSKLLEHLIRHDIDQGRGVCFLDPSDMGDTLYNVLRYCYKIGHKKVCLIDPYHRYSFGKVPVINPFHYQPSYKDASVALIMDTLRVLFKTSDASETPRIQRYLPALLRILWSAKATLYDSIYFTQKVFENQRDLLYGNLAPQDKDMMMIEDMYRTRLTQENFQSTINRLQPFYDDTMKLIFGHPEGINFPKMIHEGWVILVNLYSGFGFEPIHTRLLGTTIINEIIFGLDRLRNRGWRGVFYLYVDEAGRYANRNLADLLAYKRKSGLRVTIAHQYFNQFEDKYVLDAINNLCKLKIAFYIPNREDRDKFVRSAYGGELADRDVSFVLSGQKKQYAVIKKPKHPAHIVRIQDVVPAEVSKEKLDEYIKQIYENEWYKTPQEINNDRFPPPRKDTNGPKSGGSSNGSPTGKASVPKRVQPRNDKQGVPEGNEKPQNPTNKRPIKI
jgi:energy-coupling factor transporter ATP-binding protein EcfA2